MQNALQEQIKRPCSSSCCELNVRLKTKSTCTVMEPKVSPARKERIGSKINSLNGLARNTVLEIQQLTLLQKSQSLTGVPSVNLHQISWWIWQNHTSISALELNKVGLMMSYKLPEWRCEPHLATPSYPFNQTNRFGFPINRSMPDSIRGLATPDLKGPKPHFWNLKGESQRNLKGISKETDCNRRRSPQILGC